MDGVRARQGVSADGRVDAIMVDHAIFSRRARRAARFPVTIRVLALLVAAALALAGCVSRSRYTEVEQERELCATRYEQLRTQIERANRAGQTLAQVQAILAQEKTELATEKAALESKVATLQTQGEELGSKLHEREEEARKLQETYDGLVANLKKELKTGQVEVEQLRDGLRVNVAQDILFDSGSAALDKNGVEVLQRVASQLKKSPHQILVIGHTDNKPIGPALIKWYPTNWELAGARAASVVRLFNDSGLPAKRLLAVSVADVQPVASNKTAEGRARNRRIEIRLRPAAAEG
jgi:chemotaxis protein MotB